MAEIILVIDHGNGNTEGRNIFVPMWNCKVYCTARTIYE